MSDSGTGADGGDRKDGMDAAIPQDDAFDGDASSGAVHAGQVSGGTEAMPDDTTGPPIDGGVLGAESQSTDVGSTGKTELKDKSGESPPEEMNR